MKNSPQRTQRSVIFYLAVRGRQIKSPLRVDNVHLFYLTIPLNAAEPIAEGLPAKTLAQAGVRLVIQSPLAIGSQKRTSLCGLCASAVNLVSLPPPI